MFGEMAEKALDAGNAAVVRQSRKSLGDMRVHIASRLSQRAANAMRLGKPGQPFLLNPDQTVVGFIRSGWWRKKRGVGTNIDMFAAYERGEVIVPVRGKALAIPLPAAYAVVGATKAGRGRNRTRPTVESVEAALDQDLFPIGRHKPSGGILLAARPDTVSSRGGSRGRLMPSRYRNAKGKLVQRRTRYQAPIPMFLLLKNSRLPKRLDFGPVRSALPEELEREYLYQLSAKGVID
jgi:hypothetical protein